MYYIIDEDGDAFFTHSRDEAMSASNEEGLVVIDVKANVVVFQREAVRIHKWEPAEESEEVEEDEDDAEDSEDD